LLLVIEKDAILCVWNLFITYKSLTNGFPSVFSSLDIVVKEYICYIRSQVKVGFMVDYTSKQCLCYVQSQYKQTAPSSEYYKI